MAKGTATIDVTTEVLPLVMTLLPSTYRVIGSEPNELPDTVRLKMESEDIASGCRVHMTCMIEDAGSTRTIRVRPARPPLKD